LKYPAQPASPDLPGPRIATNHSPSPDSTLSLNHTLAIEVSATSRVAQEHAVATLGLHRHSWNKMRLSVLQTFIAKANAGLRLHRLGKY
jgi:hypothetical protein